MGINLIAQNNLGFKFFGLSIHPKGEKENAFLMPNKLDKNGYFVMNLGGEVMYENFIYHEFLSIKIIQALYADCAERLGGFSHIGLRAIVFKNNKHILSGGIGPTLIYRRSWYELEGYINKNRFKGNSTAKWQYLFLWYGGEFEYKFIIKKRFDFAISFVPGYPDLISLSIGFSYKFTKEKSKKVFS